MQGKYAAMEIRRQHCNLKFKKTPLSLDYVYTCLLDSLHLLLGLTKKHEWYKMKGGLSISVCYMDSSHAFPSETRGSVICIL